MAAVLILILIALVGASPAFAQADCVLDTTRRATAPRTASRLHLRLNIPAFRLDVFEDSILARSYTVAVGLPSYPTPRGAFAITSIEWNPWWYPPPSEWARRERVTPPGPNNPMGRVKLIFREYYYFHGTPAEGSLGSAASHGCVRMANADAIALARLVHRHATPNVTKEEIDDLVGNTRKTRRFIISEAVPVEIEYRVAEVRGDSLLLHPDIYRVAPGRTAVHAMTALVGAGFDSALVDKDRLRAAADQSRRRLVTIALPDLLIRTRTSRAPAGGWQVPRRPAVARAVPVP